MFRVRGRRVERLVAQTNFDDEESAERFQRELVRLAIDGALRKAGDSVAATRCGSGRTELEWEPEDEATVGPAPGVTAGTLATAATRRGRGRRRRRGVVPGSLGILGGTFDPVHLGHLAIAEEAREVMGLERVLFVPGVVPPHKPDRASRPADHRLAMSSSRSPATRPLPSPRSSSIGRARRTRSTPSRRSARRVGRPRAGPRFILSSEALAGFPAGAEPDRVLGWSAAVVPRAGHASRAGDGVLGASGPGGPIRHSSPGRFCPSRVA